MAGVLFDRLSLLSQIKDGNQPRKMKVLIPSLDANRIPSANKTGDNDSGSLSERLIALDDCDLRGETLAQAKQSTNCEGMFLYQSKDPVFENGNYRLNFNGRVSMPSVKNYQLVAADAIDDIICQFGKVDEDVFHLDYKAPLNAFQAFAFALCQFNL
jgi:tubby-related protein 1